ncbi:MDR family oxidoreductase [Acetobacter sp.]|uniref:acrylyl-CoA reductase (NADPH) n=1 Tax=Acetobacter sp. TaxID=440 RepID=UPI0039E81BAC
MFNALLIEKTAAGDQTVQSRPLSDAQLPEGDVTVRVAYSTLNYKDALALTGKAPIVRHFPMVPGIDFAGTVEHSDTPAFLPGQDVLLNGWGVGESHWGGLATRARVKEEWLLPLPAVFSARQAMALGTAGYTAMLCIRTLQRQGITPQSGEILVTGATGGVGSIAVMVLARLGYAVVAVTGRMEEAPFLKDLGAHDVIPRQYLESMTRPLEKARWAGAIDVAGGQLLAAVCASILPYGVVAACGLAAGMDFPATVAPFILRGVTLVGIESVSCPVEERRAAWQDLAVLVDLKKLDALTTEITLADAPKEAEALLSGKVRGRLVVKLDS